MTNAERAKQFMPFSALKGFEEAMARQSEESAPDIPSDYEPDTLFGQGFGVARDKER